MAGANGLSSKSGPSKARGATLLPGAAGVARLDIDGHTRYQIGGDTSGRLFHTRESANYYSNKVAVKEKLLRLNAAAAKASSGAKVAKLSMDGTTKFQVPGSGKLYNSQAAAQKVASAKAAAGIKARRAEVAKSFKSGNLGKVARSNAAA